MKQLSGDTLRMALGFYLVTVVALLIGIIALGKVEEDTSAGLKELEGGMLVLIGGFSQWAFSLRQRTPARSAKDDPKP